MENTDYKNILYLFVNDGHQNWKIKKFCGIINAASYHNFLPVFTRQENSVPLFIKLADETHSGIKTAVGIRTGNQRETLKEDLLNRNFSQVWGVLA